MGSFDRVSEAVKPGAIECLAAARGFDGAAARLAATRLLAAGLAAALRLAATLTLGLAAPRLLAARLGAAARSGFTARNFGRSGHFDRSGSFDGAAARGFDRRTARRLAATIAMASLFAAALALRLAAAFALLATTRITARRAACGFGTAAIATHHSAEQRSIRRAAQDEQQGHAGHGHKGSTQHKEGSFREKKKKQNLVCCTLPTRPSTRRTAAFGQAAKELSLPSYRLLSERSSASLYLVTHFL